MKKSILLLFVIAISFGTLNAQFTKVGGGLGYTSGYLFHEMNYDYNQSGHFNIYAKGIYELKLPIHLSPSITYYIPHVWKQTTSFDESKITVNTLMIDLNAHYVFNSLDRFEFYGLAGLDFLLAWKRDAYTSIGGTNPYSETIKESDNALGLNLGVGSYMKISEKMDLSLEAKYLVSRYHQFMINAGVLINLQAIVRDKKNMGL